MYICANYGKLHKDRKSVILASLHAVINGMHFELGIATLTSTAMTRQFHLIGVTIGFGADELK